VNRELNKSALFNRKRQKNEQRVATETTLLRTLEFRDRFEIRERARFSQKQLSTSMVRLRDVVRTIGPREYNYRGLREIEKRAKVLLVHQGHPSGHLDIQQQHIWTANYFRRVLDQSIPVREETDLSGSTGTFEPAKEHQPYVFTSSATHICPGSRRDKGALIFCSVSLC